MMSADSPAPRICLVCGAPLPKGRRKYCSPACSRRAERQTPHVSTGRSNINPDMMWDTRCIDCGAPIRVHIKAVRCPDCQRAADRLHAQAQRRSGPARPIGSTDRCVICGEEYVVASGLQKYCKACAATATRAAVQARHRQNERRRRADPVKGQAVREAKRIVPAPRQCEVCGSLFYSGTPSIYCSDGCRTAGQKAKYKAYVQANKDRIRQRRKEARAALTPEQRAALNARARENYKKRKAQTHIPQEDNHD